MRTVNFGSGNVNIHCQEITQHIYAKEFDYRDMVQDCIGGLDFMETGSAASLPVAALHRALWAMVKTANPQSTPNFVNWSKTQAKVDILEKNEDGVMVAVEILEELVDCTFPSAGIKL